MNTRSTTIWTFAITSVALFMTTLDNLVVTTALPVIRVQLHAGLERARVDGERLHAHLRGAADHRRRTRRPLRPAQDVRRRPQNLHAGLRRGRARALDRGADRRPRAAGPRRGDRAAADAHDPERGVPGRAPRARARRLGRDQRPRGRARPARRRRRRRGHLVAVDLLAQRPDRARSDPARGAAAEGEPRPEHLARPPGRGPGERRPLRNRVGPRAREPGRLDEPRDRARALRGSDRARPVPALGDPRRRRRCCRCGSSATGRSRPPTPRPC